MVVAGGMESMSNVPYYSSGARAGLRMGHSTLVDGMLRDGLCCPHHDAHLGLLGRHMGRFAEVGALC